jgi:hypothetical protein
MLNKVIGNLWSLKLIMLFSAYLFLQTFFASHAYAQASGTFMVVKGDVQVTSKAGETQKAKIGMKVQESDIISSGADSRAKIVMSDKNVINISPDTKLELEKYIFDPNSDNKQVSLNVLQGKVRATVEQKYDGEKNKFHVKTPSAVAGVRGTDFLTSFSPVNKETKIVTFEGRVAVGLPGPNGSISNPVYVNPGQTTSAQGGGSPSKPQSVPANDLKNMNSESQADAPKSSDKKDTASGESKEKEEKKDEKKEESKDEKKEDKKDAKEDKKDEKKEDKKSTKEEAKEDKKDSKESKNEVKEDKKEASKDDSAKETSKESPKEAAKDSPKENAKETPKEVVKETPSEPKQDQRQPASSAPPPSAPPGGGVGSMINSSDLMPNLGDSIINPNIQTVVPTTNFQPVVAAPITQITDKIPQEVINNANTNTSSKVNIIINKN